MEELKKIQSVEELINKMIEEEINIYELDETIFNKCKDKGISVNIKTISTCKEILKIIFKMKEEGKSIETIAWMLNNKGINISQLTIENTIESPINNHNVNYDELLKEIILNGYTIEEYIAKTEGSELDMARLYISLDKFMLVAKNAKKPNGEICTDEDLMTVLKMLERKRKNPLIENSISRVENYLKPSLKMEGKIDNIHMRYFSETNIQRNNTMCYILTRMKKDQRISFGKYDEEIYKTQKEFFSRKLDQVIKAIQRTKNDNLKGDTEDSRDEK